MGNFQWCIPDPDSPGEELCMDIPVKIDPTQVIVDRTILTGSVTEGLRTDVAVLVAVDQLATQVSDDGLRAYLVNAVDEMVAQLGGKLPSGVALKRTS
jgi:hypothetical protein